MRLLLAGVAICLLCGADRNDAIKKDLEQLQGEWSMVSGERDGQALPEELLKSATRVTKERETTVTIGGQVFMKADITVDPTKKPKTIDYKLTDGTNKGKTILGIYELNGDKVKFCFAGPDKERPNEFATKADSGLTLSEWKRNKK